MPETKIKIGPATHGQRMSLADFEFAEVEQGHRYELIRGVVTVSDIPKPRHMRRVSRLHKLLNLYDALFPDHIYAVTEGAGCKVLIPQTESERHPDLAVYKTEPPSEDDDVWRIWLPEIVAEVVSLSSRLRDYEEKREDYLAVGIREYWIIDEETQELTVLKRHGNGWRERVLKPDDVYETRLLPGFQLKVADLFAEANTPL